MGAILGLPWPNAQPWLLLIIACHDLGKACPSFQGKWEHARPALKAEDLPFPPGSNRPVNHAWVSQVILKQQLQERGWAIDLAELVADAVGCHHGERAGSQRIERLRFDPVNILDPRWSRAIKDLFQLLLDFFRPIDLPAVADLSGPDFMLLAGLTSFADWIGSNEEHFGFGHPEDCHDLKRWWQVRSLLAEQAMDAIQWRPRTPLLPAPRPFQSVFPFPPRPL
jgi:CRISPR-associated endonuclease/helicase Cas3